MVGQTGLDRKLVLDLDPLLVQINVGLQSHTLNDAEHKLEWLDEMNIEWVVDLYIHTCTFFC